MSVYRVTEFQDDGSEVFVSDHSSMFQASAVARLHANSEGKMAGVSVGEPCADDSECVDFELVDTFDPE